MKKVWGLLLAAVLLTVLCACAQAEKVLHIYLKDDCPTMNGQTSVESSINTPMTYCGATLYRAIPTEDGMGYEFIGEIADGMPEQVDKNTWHIKIRPEACFANGEPITADTIVYSLKTGLDPKLTNAMADFISSQAINIKNAKAYSIQTEAEPVAWEDVGIRKTEDGCLEIITEDEVTQMDVCNHFTTRAMVPLYEPLYEAGMNEDRTKSDYGLTVERWMSSGPYKLTKWVYKSIQVYERNEHYWNPDLCHYDRVEVNIIPEANARMEMWERGDLDLYTPDPSALEQYIDDPRIEEIGSLTVYHIDVNDKNPDNPICSSNNYRKALYYAINRPVIAKEIFGYQEAVGTYVNNQAGIYSPSGLAYRDSAQGKEVTEMVESWGPAGYNPEMANKYLDAAYEEFGMPKDTVLTLIIGYNPNEASWKPTAEYLQEELPKVFNGRIQLKSVTYSTSTTEFKKGTDQWDLSPNDWSRTLSRTYPHAAFYYFTSGYANHPNVYVDAEFDAQYAVCDSDEVRMNYDRLLDETAKLEKIYLDKVIHIPVCQEVGYELYSDRVVLPMKQYLPVIGWGLPYGDINE